MWFESIPLGKGYFSDTGYRLRKNSFDHKDYYWPFAETLTKEFFEYKKFNSDIFYNSETSSSKIASMYFRIQTDKINHSRTVYGFMDWLGDVGGINEVMSAVFIFILGGYLRFNFMVATMQSLYSPTSFGVSDVLFHEKGSQGCEDDNEGG